MFNVETSTYALCTCKLFGCHVVAAKTGGELMDDQVSKCTAQLHPL